MCLVVFALGGHPDFPLIIFDNRDEWRSRASVRAQVAPDGVLCGSDPKAGGTWMGLNVKTGRFTVLTNLGGATKAGQPSRGAMVLAFLRQRLSGAAAGVSVKDAVSELLRARKEYAPFNLLWADVYAEHPAVHYTANKFPEDAGAFGGQIVHSFRSNGGTTGGGGTESDSVIVGMGNDLLFDEFVKCPYVERGLRRIIVDSRARAPASGAAAARTEAESKEAIHAVRDQLGDLFSRTSAPPGSALQTLLKFFTCSARRRVQPGTAAALVASPVLGALGAVMGAAVALLSSTRHASESGWQIGAGIGGAVGLAAVLAYGLWMHWRLQAPFVTVRRPWAKDVWQTVSQSACIVDKSGTAYYYYRNTIDGPRPGGEGWSEFVVPKARAAGAADAS